MNLKDFTLLLIRLFLGFVFFSSGLCKLADGNFGQLIGPPDLINQLAEYGLEQFGYFIAISQVLFGTLILTQRFSIIGLIALVPMNVSILATTLSLDWQGTPFVNVFLLVLNLIALLYEWPALKILLMPAGTNYETPFSIRFFPNLLMPIGIIILSILAILFAKGGGIILNIIAAIILIAVCWNLFQKDIFTKVEKAVLIFYSITTLLIVFMKVAVSYLPTGQFSFLLAALIGFIFYIISIGQRFLKKS